MVIIPDFQGENPGFGFNKKFFALVQAFFMDKSGNATQTIAALFCFAAIGIVNPTKKISHPRWLDNQKLVKSNTHVAISKTMNRQTLNVERLVQSINNHKVIAETMHFGKGDDFLIH